MSHRYLERIAEEYMLGVTNPGICERCNTDTDLIIEVPSMSRYQWDGVGENPNRDPKLCIYCANKYVTYWEERLMDYYWSVL